MKCGKCGQKDKFLFVMTGTWSSKKVCVKCVKEILEID